jgi:peptidoglycan L-alanyl-D-glutamate endopeptidase CwlK
MESEVHSRYYNLSTHPDQMYFLNEESEKMLSEVQPELAEVVKRAVAISDIEIQVLHGKRTKQQQVEFFKKGVAPKATSAHLYGHAVDLGIIIEGRLCYELELYDELALNMKYASEDLHTPIRWGGAWILDTITGYDGLIPDLQNYYIDICREQGQRPQLDIQHFELTVA